MPSANALLATAVTAIGAAALGMVAYMQVNPLAFTSAAPALPEPEQAQVAVFDLTEPPDTMAGVVLEPVLVTGTVRATNTQPKAAGQAKPKKELVVCSEWQGLASGPADRHVRVLCETGVPNS